MRLNSNLKIRLPEVFSCEFCEFFKNTSGGCFCSSIYVAKFYNQMPFLTPTQYGILIEAPYLGDCQPRLEHDSTKVINSHNALMSELQIVKKP